MTLTDRLVALANDYISGRVGLGPLDELVHEDIDEWLKLDETGAPAALLSSFIQVRIYQLQDGAISEDEIRREVAEYLAEHKLLRPVGERRSAG